MGIFDVKSVAVVGVSNNEKKAGNIIFRNLIKRFNGEVFPVNPKYETILGIRCYKSLEEIEKDIDAVIISIPAEGVPEVVKQAVNKRAKLVIIISSGFSEVGRKDLEEEILKYIKNSNTRVLGPNGLGIYDPYTGLDSFFIEDNRIKRPKKGNIALLSQSGALAMAFMEWLSEKDIGVSKIISYGNKIDLDEVDLIKELNEDSNTKAIFIYMEGLRENRGREFLELCNKINKPIVVLKAGKSKRGAIAVSSHTAAMAGDYEIYSNLFKQFNIIEAKNMHDFMTYLKTLAIYL